MDAKYLEKVGEDSVYPTLEGMGVAVAIGMGRHYKKYGIDPMEAVILLTFCKDFAKDTDKDWLIKSCNKVREELQSDLDAYCILLDADII